jgi:sec-independent protein translocase protein TatA
MFGAHLPELVLILVGALVLFGPKRLPEIGSSLGRGIRDFKKHVSDVDGSSTAGDIHYIPDPVEVTVPRSPGA